MSDDCTPEQYEEQIDDLEDMVHDLRIDLQDSYKTIDQLENTIEKLENKLDTIEDACEKVRIAQVENLTEKIQALTLQKKDLEENVTKITNQLMTRDQNYLNILCMAETIRQKNYAFFDMPEGRKLLEWAERELQVMKHKWR